MTIGERIQTARKNAGMKQSELAEKIGVAVITIGQYERGKRQPRYEQLERIADALNVPLEVLLGIGESVGIDGAEERDKKITVLKFSTSAIMQAIEVALKQLNDAGQQKAVERLEELAEIPKYQRQGSPVPPESTPSPPEDKDITKNEDPS